MHLSTDNKAATALKVFIKSVKEYGIPSRIRLDGGTEFNHIEYLMNILNGENRGSVMRGASVHNQRIERLWRDVFCKALDRFYKVFKHMEDHHILDTADPIHMFSLQYTFTPRIQRCLQNWVQAHNSHPVRTERNKTPLQLWYSGSLSSQQNDSTAMNNLFRRDLQDIEQVLENTLTQYNLVEPNDIAIVLPRYAAPLTEAQLNGLTRSVKPFNGKYK